MILAYLILAHLLGDFVFQPSKLVFWKMKSKKGTFIHALIHFVISAILLIPYLINGYLWLLAIAFGISFIHFWIDETKISYDLKHDEKVKPFILDQLTHLITIIVASLFTFNANIYLPKTPFYQIYSDVRLTIFLTVLVFITTVVEIFHFTRDREEKGAKNLKIDTGKMLTRVIVFSIIYAAVIILGFYVGELHFLQ